MRFWGRQFWRDRKFWRWSVQAFVLLVVVIFLVLVGTNLATNLQRLNIELGFNFLQSQASFDIKETLIPYQRFDPYRRALLVGLLNTLRIIIAGMILTTIVGISVGIARLADNWLVRKLAMIYVEILRNTPLLLQLLFWYFAVFLNLPPAENAISIFNLLYFTNEGIILAVPWNVPQVLTTGIIQGGFRLSSEFSALLIGLTLYTAAFIAEIVRGGIQSVPLGQWEAAKALGLKPSTVMRLVVFPQALRAIIPPLTSQYLNLVKNSSLAIAIAYPDFYNTASTTFSQTERVVEIMLIIMATYLIIDLIVAGAMNVLNQAVKLRER